MSATITAQNPPATTAACSRLVLLGVLPTGEVFLFNVKELAETVGDIDGRDPANICEELLCSEQFAGFTTTRIHSHVLSSPKLPNHHYVVVEFSQVPNSRWPVGLLPFFVAADMFPHCLRSKEFDADLKQVARWLSSRGLITA